MTGYHCVDLYCQRSPRAQHSCPKVPWVITPPTEILWPTGLSSPEKQEGWWSEGICPMSQHYEVQEPILWQKWLQEPDSAHAMRPLCRAVAHQVPLLPCSQQHNANKENVYIYFWGSKSPWGRHTIFTDVRFSGLWGVLTRFSWSWGHQGP